jgi:hypothetical protein
VPQARDGFIVPDLGFFFCALHEPTQDGSARLQPGHKRSLGNPALAFFRIAGNTNQPILIRNLYR